MADLEKKPKQGNAKDVIEIGITPGILASDIETETLLGPQLAGPLSDDLPICCLRHSNPAGSSTMMVSYKLSEATAYVNEVFRWFHENIDKVEE
ncbi:hypothetical protein MMC13_007407 [Lambiella insularis]|nr:hypothetical protein [Lambiella insularis]